MEKFTKQKGITLVALIITIIVMLILVAVTISVALNGGLFEKGKDASDKTQREADREELLSAIYGTLDNKGNLQIGDNENGVESKLSNGWNIEETTNASYIQCTSPKNEIFYVNKETGAISSTLPQAGGGGDEERYNISIKNLNSINWSSVLTLSQNGKEYYILNILPSGENLETLEDAIDEDNFYQLSLSFDDGVFSSASFCLLGTDYSWVKDDGGYWDEDEGDGVLNSIQISQALIVPAANTNAMLQDYGLTNWYAVPDTEVDSIINKT